MVKFDKPIETKCVSEYIASKLARVLGIECQEVTLGTYKNCKVCVIELFTKDDEIIHHFYDINDSSVSGAISRDVRDLPYSLDYIISIIITETDIISVFSDKYLSSFIRQDKLEVLKIITIKRYRLLKEELDCR